MYVWDRGGRANTSCSASYTRSKLQLTCHNQQRLRYSSPSTYYTPPPTPILPQQTTPSNRSIRHILAKHGRDFLALSLAAETAPGSDRTFTASSQRRSLPMKLINTTTYSPLSPLVQATPTLLSPFFTSSHDPAPHFISLMRVAPVQLVPDVRKMRERKCERPSLLARKLRGELYRGKGRPFGWQGVRWTAGDGQRGKQRKGAHCVCVDGGRHMLRSRGTGVVKVVISCWRSAGLASCWVGFVVLGLK